MGAKLDQIPALVNARSVINDFPLVKADDYGLILSNNEKWDGKRHEEIAPDDTLKFEPIESWRPVFYK